LATNLLFLDYLTDEPTCYKVFDSKVIKSIKNQCEKFDWEPEVMQRY